MREIQLNQRMEHDGKEYRTEETSKHTTPEN
jgi:hypothetical protein